MITNYNKFILENNNTNINNIIDFTHIKQNSNINSIKDFCKTAIDNKYYSICVLPSYLTIVKAFIEPEDDIKIVAHINYNENFYDTIQEINDCIVENVDEIDVVFNIEEFKKLKTLKETDLEKFQDLYDDIEKEIRTMSKLCHENGIIIKLIIEIEELTYNEIIDISKLCYKNSIDYIQTSSGNYNSNLIDKIDKLKFMKKILPDNINIKLSGGIKNKEDIKSIMNLIDRIGTSTEIK